MKPAGPLLVFAVIVAACGVPSSNVASTTTSTMLSTTLPADPAAELAAARQLWQETGPDTYWLELINDCGECDPSMRAPQIVVVWSGNPVGPEHHTVESLFAQIETAIAEERTVEVSYDAEMGYPTEISVDMQDRAFDGGHHLLVGDLVEGLPGQDVAIDALEEARSLWEGRRPEAYQYRTTIHCDCEIDGRVWTQVEDNRIIDWYVDYQQETDTPISPLTIDMMFDDLAEMLSLAEGVEADGVRFTGSASYHPELGYPTWIGLDIEILDPESQLGFLPPRLIFSVDRFMALDLDAKAEPTTESDEARVRWEAAGPTSYQYELRIHDIEHASFTDPYVVSVTRGVVSSIEYQGGLVDDPPEVALPIDMLFDLIDSRIFSGDTVDALYHGVLGYPVLVTVHDASTARPEIFSIHELTAAD